MITEYLLVNLLRDTYYSFIKNSMLPDEANWITDSHYVTSEPSYNLNEIGEGTARIPVSYEK